MCRSRYPLAAVALFLLLGVVALAGGIGARRVLPSQARLQAGYARLPLSFEANQGHADGEVQFLSRGPGYSLFLTGTEAVLSLRSSSRLRAFAWNGGSGTEAVLSLRSSGDRGQGTAARDAARAVGQDPPNTQHPTPNTHLRMSLAGANPEPEARGLERLPGVSHYFLGNDPKQWRTNVPHYAKVRYEEVYPGIDLVYYGNQQQLEYDFVVAPHAAPDQVRLAFTGADRIELDRQGDLLLHTPAGVVRQHRPILYQEDDGRRQSVEGEYRLLADGRIGFDIGPYDDARALVIDPVLVYATFLGGQTLNYETVDGIAVDAAGSAYVTGWTDAADFPTKNALQPAAPGNLEAFVAKLTPDGSALVYSTYLGGSNADWGRGIVADAGGNAYVTGETLSANFPTTAGAFDPTFEREAFNRFVTRLSTDGSVLAYSTYLGQGTSAAIALEREGVVCITGTAPAGYYGYVPTTPGAFDPSANGGTDAFVVKLNATGDALIYGSYLGGRLEDAGTGIAVDDSGHVWVSGWTRSDDFPAVNAPWTTNSGHSDAFVARVSPDGSTLTFSTYMGGDSDDGARAVAVDPSGAACVTGEAGPGFPVTPGAYDTTFNGSRDAFVARFSPAGAPLYSTFLGGSGYEAGVAVAADASGSAYVTGAIPDSSDFPLVDPLSTWGGSFAVKVNPAGSALVYSTLLGYIGRSSAIAVDGAGTAYLGGDTERYRFPLTHPVQPVYGGGRSDAFIVKLAGASLSPPTNLSGTPVAGPRMELSWRDNSTNETGFVLERLESGAFRELARVEADVASFSDASVVDGGEYHYRVRAVSAEGYSDFAHTPVGIRVPPSAPTDLRAQAVSTSEIRLDWRDNSSVERFFEVEYRTEGQEGHAGGIAPNTTTWTYRGAVPNAVYSFRVRAYGNVPSDYSNEATAATHWVTDLAAEALSHSAIRLTWTDGSAGEEGFRVERRSGTGAFATVGTAAADATTFTDAGLTEVTKYIYRVTPLVAGTEGLPLEEVSATTLLAAPDVLAAEAVSAERVRLTWRDNSSAERGFRLERKPGPPAGSGTYAEIRVLPLNASSFTDSELEAGTTYTYRLRAYRDGSLSVYSSEATVTTLTTPDAPEALTAVAATGPAVRLTWVDVSGSEEGFRIERKSGQASDPGTYTEIGTTGPNTRAHTDSGVTLNATYTYRVRAYNSSGPSPYSSEATVTVGPPAAPSHLTATAVHATRIRLTWRDNSAGEVGFRLERKIGSGAFVDFLQTQPNATAYTDPDLTPGTTYTYRVRARNPLGSSAYSNEASATTPAPKDAPEAPSDLVAVSPFSTRVRLTWKDNSSNEQGFRIERKVGSGAFVDFRVMPANSTAYTDPDLGVGVTYTYRVRAYNNGSYSPYSNEATVTTAVPPAAPSNLALTTVDDSRIRLTWTDNSTNETGFRIERKPGPPEGPDRFLEVRQVRADVTSFTDVPLATEATYTYRVRAHNAVGFSGYSNTASIFTLGTPTGLTATVASESSIKLEWKDTSFRESGFKIERKTGAPGEDGSYQEIGTVGTGVRTYLDTALRVNTTYTYRVRAYSASGTSAYSDEASIAFVLFSIGGRVTEEAAGLAGVQVSASAALPTGTWINRSATTGADGAYSLRSLPAGEYQVRTFRNGYGIAPAGRTVTVGPDATGVDFTAVRLPAAPSGLTAVAVSSTRIELAWTDNSDNESGFKLFRYSDRGGSQVVLLDANVTAHTDNDLRPNARYQYSLAATNAGGDSHGGQASVFLLAAPVHLAATALSGTEILVGWYDTTNGESGFRIERKAAGGEFAQVATTAANITQFTDRNLETGGTYTYRVRAYNSSGHSDYSNEDSAALETFEISGKITRAGAGLAGVAVAAASTSNSLTREVFDVMPIPDPGTVEIPLAVTAFGRLTSVRVGVQLYMPGSRTTISLIHPDGTTVLLDSEIILGPFLGSYPDMAPIESLAVLQGKPITGTWKMRVRDEDWTFDHEGQFERFTLELTYASALGAATATTAADGTFAIRGLPAGTYTVTPSYAGHAFTPTSRTVRVGPDADWVDFTAEEQPPQGATLGSAPAPPARLRRRAPPVPARRPGRPQRYRRG